MSVQIQPIAELSHRARQVLIQELGVVDALRYLNQFRTGNGDYTVEREHLFPEESVKDSVAGIKAQRKQSGKA